MYSKLEMNEEMNELRVFISLSYTIISYYNIRENIIADNICQWQRVDVLT